MAQNCRFFSDPDNENGFLSNNFMKSFTLNGDVIEFSSVKQAKEYSKARLFQDYDIIPEIIATYNPNNLKELGRRIKNFNENIWKQHRYDIVYQAVKAKFFQNTELRVLLQNTHNDILVYASPLDKIWGIGLLQNDVMVQNPENWNGLNLLGKILERVREQL